MADLVAESFAQALIGLPRYDASRGDPNAWLFGIVSNQLSAYWRRGTVERRAQKRLAMERQLPDADDLERIDRFGEEPVAVALWSCCPTSSARPCVNASCANAATTRSPSRPVCRKRPSASVSAVGSPLCDD